MLSQNIIYQESQQAPKSAQTSCTECRSYKLCFMKALKPSVDGQLEAKVKDNVKQPQPLHKDKHLYRQGDPLSYLYIVRSGAVKTVRTFNNGTEQVTGFFLRGQIFGFDAIAQNRYTTTAVALETTSVCKIPYNMLDDLFGVQPELRQHFMTMMAEEIIREQQRIALLGQCLSEERLAYFLVNLSEHFASQGLSSTSFTLPMTRSDIANFLGLTVETVCRLLKRFQKDNWIKVSNRDIQLLDLPMLSAYAQRNSKDLH